MELVDAMAFLGAVLAAAISVPQFWLVARSRDTHGLALASWVIALGTGIGWLNHGVRLAEIHMIWPNVLSLIITVTILCFLRSNGRYRSFAVWLPGLALGGLLAGLDYGLGTAAFGMAVVVPQGYGMARQGVELVRALQVTGVSIPTWVLQVACQLVWLIWAIWTNETGTLICAAISLVIASFVLCWRILRACGLGPIGGRRSEAASDPDRTLAYCPD